MLEGSVLQPVRSPELGPAERIELGLGAVVNSLRRQSRAPNAHSLARLQQDLARFVSTQTGALPADWLRQSSGCRVVQLWADPLLDCAVQARIWAPGARAAICDSGPAPALEALWLGELHSTDFEAVENTRAAVRLRTVRQQRWQAPELIDGAAVQQLCNGSSDRIAISIRACTRLLPTTTVYHVQNDDWYQLGQQLNG